MIEETDVVIVGAGPVGLFAVFELGLLNIKCHVIDSLSKVGGQCAELYPDKPIYDIPARHTITGQDLTDELMKQSNPFSPIFHLNQQVESIKKTDKDNWIIKTNSGKEINTKCIVIAAGAGSFVPRKPSIEGIEDFENINVFFSIREKNIFKNQNVLIAGGGDSALDWTNELSKIANVKLIHRRKEFRASPDSVNKMLDLSNKNVLEFIIGQLRRISQGENKALMIEYEDEQSDLKKIEVDYLLPFYGLKTELGPISKWGLNLNENLIKVDTEKFETSIPKIFAIGDINIYPGKLKLILSGFHEAALMAQQCFKYCFPNKKNIFRYTTSSKDLHKKLGVK